ncbi:MAG: glycosyltransferase family 2 protein, partial [Gammaproteobacteria bacterium]
MSWSVVVPTFQRPALLATCVRAIAALQPPPDGFEIIVVNDGGEDPPDAVRAAAVAGNTSLARFVTQPNQGPGVARNHGAAIAQGQWLAFIDDDCAPDPSWLVVLDRALASSPDALVGGAVHNALQRNLFSETSQVLAEFVMDWFDGIDRERFFTSNNIALSRSAFQDAGGFDASLGSAAGEDREFCDRWHAGGRPSIREPRAIVHHSHDLTLRSFLRQHHAYGAGASLFRALRRNTDRPLRIDLGFYAASLRHAWRGRPPLRGAALASLTAAAHGAYVAGLAGAR